MNISEAKKVLEIPANATADEAKKAFRKLAAKYHPDVNKTPEAEERFKKINEAYQTISNPKEEVSFYTNSNPFNPFARQTSYNAEHISLNTTISFKESVIGAKKDLKFHRKSKCKECNGQGKFQINNGCDKCNGRGQIVNQRGGMIFAQTCDKCQGRVQVSACSPCNQSGVVDSEMSINVSIPGGVISGNILRLGGMGNFVGSFGPMDQHTDVHLHITVDADPNLSLDGETVISNITISLLEALTGCKKTVNTIMGDKEIEIKPLSKNKDTVILPKLGVNRSGNQSVILNVMYPEDTNLLISTLISNEGKV